MNTDVKKRWIDALRSGKYNQGKTALRDGDKYCALGVLYEVEHGKKAWRKMDGLYTTDTGSAGQYRPTSIDRNDIAFIEWQNDRGVSFAKLAEYIQNYIF